MTFGRRVALLLAPDLRQVAVLIAEALDDLGELERIGATVNPEVVQARRKLAQARALLRGS